MEDLMTCSVCLRKFEDPRVLPCQHTFCLKPCLEKLFDTNMRHVKCPLCRVTHFVSKGCVNNLPKNFTIQSIMEMSTNKKLQNKICALCKGKVTHVKNCECCFTMICNVCYELHMQQTKKKLQKLSDNLSQNLSYEKECFRNIIKNISEIDSEKNQLLLSVDQAFNETNDILQKRKLEFIEKINEKYEPTYTILKSLGETKEIDIAVLSSSIQSAVDSIAKENCSQGHLISLFTSIENTKPTRTQTDYSKLVKIETGEFVFNIDSIKNSISKFGKLKWSSDKLDSVNIKESDVIQEIKECQVDTSETIANEILDVDSTLNRNKTFILDRPPKSVSYEIPSTRNLPNPISLQSIYMQKSLPSLIFGSKGTGMGEFIWPRGITIDNETNKIIVADSSNHRIQIFSDRGDCEKVISSLKCDNQVEGNFPLTFDCLSGIAMKDSKNIVCSDRYNHRAIVMDINGNFVSEIGKGINENATLSFPWGIAIDSNLNILICDKDNHRIQVFSSKGEYIKEIGSHGRQTGMFDNPHYLAICPKTKNIFVSDTSNHRIQVFDKNGTFLYSFSGDGPTKLHLKYPRGITVDNDGNVLVCDYGNNRISVFTNEGKLIFIFGSHGSNRGQFKGLEGIAVFKDGRIVVSDRDNHRIQIF